MLTVYNRLDFTDLNEYTFRHWIEVDGTPQTVHEMVLNTAPHTSVAVNICYTPVTCRFGATVNTQLLKDGREVAHTQHDLPCTIREEVREPQLELTQDDHHIYARGENFVYTFSKHYGAFTSMQVNGREQLAGSPVLSAWRAPTDNDRNIRFRWMQLDEWQGENLDKTFVKIYDCWVEDHAILVSGSLAGISRAPVVRFAQRIEIGREGRISLTLRGTVRADAIWLPRLGFEWTLPGAVSDFTYYGNGPVESYRDLCHAGAVSLHSSNADREYVRYVRPQEHGNHTAVKMLRIGDLEFSSQQMEIHVSR